MVPPEHAQYLNCLTSAYIGRIYFYLTDFAGSIAHVQSNIPHLERQGRAAEAANSLSLLTLNYAFTGTFEESVSLFAAITEIADSRNNPGIMALCKLCQGFTALLRGDWEEAGVLLPDAAEISSKIGNHTIAGLAIWGRGRAAGMLGDFDRGVSLMEEGIEVIASRDSRFGLGACHGMIAECKAIGADKKQAVADAEKSLELAAQGADKLGEPSALRALALAASGKKAEGFILKSLKIAGERGMAPDVAIGHFRYAELLHDSNDLPSAEAKLAEAARLFRKMKMANWERETKALKRTLSRR